MAPFDLNKLAASAVESYLQHADPHEGNGSSNGQVKAKQRRIGTGAAMAMGVGLTLAARAAYHRVREIDLEQVGTAVEDKLKS
jgi:hypothetical protein